MFQRLLTISYSSSFFLFGARGTGKTFALNNTFFKQSTKNIWHIDLLLTNEEIKYSDKPEILYKEVLGLPNLPDWIIIDEIQKVPRLLDIVHKLIEEKNIKFALTGSSARKLKRNNANLLAGRAFFYNFFPLTFIELNDKFKLSEVLHWGSLPKIFSLKEDFEKKLFLESYTETYLKEEVLIEQLIRQLPPFRRFLEIASQMNGEEINYLNIAKDIRVDSKTVENYYTILEDTLLGFTLPVFSRSLRKQQSKSPKFYFFDLGVKRALSKSLDIPIQEKTEGYGRSFEHFIIIEIFRLNNYLRKNYKLSFFRSKDGAEIDLIIEKPNKETIFIEIKAASSIDERHTNPINRIIKDLPKESNSAFCFSNDPVRKIFDNVTAVPWQEGIKEIGLIE